MIEELDAENTEGDNGENFRGYLHRNVTTRLLEHLLDPQSIAEGLSARKQGKSPHPYILIDPRIIVHDGGPIHHYGDEVG